MAPLARAGSGSSSGSFTQRTLSGHFTPSKGQLKRVRADEDGTPSKKRARGVFGVLNGIEETGADGAEEYAKDTDVDVFGGRKVEQEEEERDCARPVVVNHSFARAVRANASMRPGRSSRYILPPSRPLLASFASSDTADRYLCPSSSNAFFTPPYALSYSHAASRGGAQHLAVATEEGTLYIYDTSSSATQQRADLRVHDNGVFDVQWSAADDRLATASADGTVAVLDARTGTPLVRLGEGGHNTTVKTLAWNPTHADLLASGGRDGVLCLWDLRTPLAPITRIAHAHEELLAPGRRRAKSKGAPRPVTGLLFTENVPHGILSAGSASGVLRLWDLRAAGKKGLSDRAASTPARMSAADPTLRGAPGRARGLTALCGGAGGAAFALGCDSRVHAYDTGSLGAFEAEMAHKSLRTGSFFAPLAVSPCARWAAVGGLGGAVVVFDVEGVGRAHGRPPGQGVLLQAPGGAEVTGVSWARDALAVCADDGTVRVWRDYSERRGVNSGVGGAELIWAMP